MVVLLAKPEEEAVVVAEAEAVLLPSVLLPETVT